MLQVLDPPVLLLDGWMWEVGMQEQVLGYGKLMNGSWIYMDKTGFGCGELLRVGSGCKGVDAKESCGGCGG